MGRVKIRDRKKTAKEAGLNRKKLYPGKGKLVGTRRRSEQKKIGRPTKRNADTERAVLEVLKLGLGYGDAAAAAGISEVTLREWRNGDALFARDCEQARMMSTKGAAAALAIAIRAGNMTAAIFHLKTHSKAYQEKVRLEISEEEAPEPDESFL